MDEETETQGPRIRRGEERIAMTTIILRSIAIGAALYLIGTSADAAGTKAVAVFEDWSAHVINEKAGKICYLFAKPVKSDGKYESRGDTYVQVAHRANGKVRNEVSVTAGYEYKKGSEVTLTIDGKKFALFTSKDTAWSRDAEGDAALVAAMRAGRSMTIEGTSSRGTETRDVYRLIGFTAAHRTIDKACKAE